MTTPTVETVLGPVSVTELGPTLVHEHIRISYPGDELDPTSSWDRTSCIEVAVERMQQLQEFGIKTFVDPCTIELGRDPELMAEVARRSGMQIVCTTGFYHEDIGLPYYWRLRTVEEITELYLHEIENGIGDTGIKPGAIKIASGDPVTELEKKFVHAGASAARASGLTVITHCENSVGSDVQQAMLSEHGVDPGRCLIGHQDQAPEVKQLLEIAERGSFVGIDRVGIEILSPDDHRVELVLGLLDAGYAERLCLSQDHMCCLQSARFPYEIPEGMEEAVDQMKPLIYDQLYRRPHTYLFTEFWPRLEKAGVEPRVLDSILIDNPRRLFGG
ncbi:MAG: phosphotriesterase family protein [Actinomycetota bacterium]